MRKAGEVGVIKQISMEDLLPKEEKTVRIEPPAIQPGEKVYTIPDEVWKERCSKCVHKQGQENIAIPGWALYKNQYSDLLPCRILGLARANERPGECMSFAPRIDVYGICDSCRHNNIFTEGFCMKKDHAEQRRVYWGKDYGGDEKKKDYYARHRLSVCDDYEPDLYVNI